MAECRWKRLTKEHSGRHAEMHLAVWPIAARGDMGGGTGGTIGGYMYGLANGFIRGGCGK